MIRFGCESTAMIRYSSLFRSRWLALLWSAGIVWSAAEFAGSQDSGDTVAENAVDDDGANLKQVQDLVGKLESRSER